MLMSRNLECEKLYKSAEHLIASGSGFALYEAYHLTVHAEHDVTSKSFVRDEIREEAKSRRRFDLHVKGVVKKVWPRQ